jgi:hypothetical protein
MLKFSRSAVSYLVAFCLSLSVYGFEPEEEDLCALYLGFNSLSVHQVGGVGFLRPTNLSEALTSVRLGLAQLKEDLPRLETQKIGPVSPAVANAVNLFLALDQQIELTRKFQTLSVQIDLQVAMGGPESASDLIGQREAVEAKFLARFQGTSEKEMKASLRNRDMVEALERHQRKSVMIIYTDPEITSKLYIEPWANAQTLASALFAEGIRARQIERRVDFLPELEDSQWRLETLQWQMELEHLSTLPLADRTVPGQDIHSRLTANLSLLERGARDLQQHIAQLNQEEQNRLAEGTQFWREAMGQRADSSAQIGGVEAGSRSYKSADLLRIEAAREGARLATIQRAIASRRTLAANVTKAMRP